MNVSPKQRTETINIRVTPAEKAYIETMAQIMEMTVTQFIVRSTIEAWKIGQEGKQ